MKKEVSVTFLHSYIPDATINHRQALERPLVADLLSDILHYVRRRFRALIDLFPSPAFN